MLRWMSSTSVTAGPGLIALPIQRSLSFSSPISMHAEKLLRAAVEVLLVARLGQREPFTELAVDLGREEEGAALVEFHGPMAFVRGQGFEP